MIKSKEVDRDLLAKGASAILTALGEDVGRQGLIDTPKRVAKFYSEFLHHEPFALTAFDNDGSNEMIVQSNIEFYSLCEHHQLSFFGTAAVGYIPGDKIIGLSKLARCVDYCARRLQNQERITKQVADMLQEALNPKGVAVVLKARHLCMEMRGIKKRGAVTTTSCLYGSFMDEPAARSEFLAFAHELSTI